jgi:hypothetical protein
MTYQKDPNSSEPETNLGREPRGNYARRADGSWNILPLVLGALAIVVVGYMFLGDRFAPDRSSNTSIDRPNTSVPKTTPTQPN